MTQDMQTLTVEEADKLLRLHKARLYALIRSGQIPVIRLGRSLRIRAKALLEWMEQRERPALDGRRGGTQKSANNGRKEGHGE